MENKNFTRLTLEQNNLKITWEVPYDNINGEDMMNAIKTIMIGMSFLDDTIYQAMFDYVLENRPDVVDKINK